jgi:type IV pilus assembly protein PilW
VKTLLIPTRSQAGFSLVELMVGMVIGLVAVVIMFQVFAVSESQRRTTTGVGDAQQNGASAMFIMERDVRTAGYGLSFWPVLGCRSHGYYRATGLNFDFTLAPVLLTDGGAGAPDSLTITYGNPATYALPAAISQPSNTFPNELQMMSPRFQFAPGDLMLVSEVPVLPTDVLKDCWVTQVTDLPAANNTRVAYGAGTFDDNGVTRVAQYSLAGAIPVTYAKWNPTKGIGGRVFNLGPQPVSVTYKIINNQLVAVNAFDGAITPIADGIVQMQAQVGYSSSCGINGLAGNCYISSLAPVVPVISTSTAYANGVWGDAMGPIGLPTDYRKIISVRLAIVARSATPEKKDALGNCTATTVQPTWLANNNSTLTVNTDPDWGCYRYKVFELMIPLRNMLWFADPDGTPVPPA